MQHYKHIILGGGVAAGYAAQTFAEYNCQAGDVAIISADDTLPYDRPPLSKDFLQGKETTAQVLINDADFYADNHIRVLLQTRITDVDFGARTLTSDAGETFSFDKLLITTGSHLRRLNIPNGDLDKVEYLRSDNQARRIRHDADTEVRAVVVGGGYIGMETAASLTEDNIIVTMVYPNAHFLEGIFSSEMGEFFENYFRERGITLSKGHEVTSFIGEDGAVRGVVLDNGDTLPADFAVVGIGVEPNTGLFEDTPLILDEPGIRLNEYLQTSIPDVYAAGDVASYQDVVMGGQTRLEHWDAAKTQGQHAAQAMISGKPERFEYVPYFFSDVFDLSYEIWGQPGLGDKIVYRGDVARGAFSAWWLTDDNRVVAGFVMNRPNTERQITPQLIAEGREVKPEVLSDERYDLGEMFGQAA
ncbi:MAG: NAD(P)/FAD-dependent oxidoreductase [Anaerolineales bacterium]